MPALRVLVAEDDASIRDLLRHHLLCEGLNVCTAGDGNMALRMARNWAELLILDVGLPAIDGFEVARTLRREKRELPIIMLSAYYDLPARVDLLVDAKVVKGESTQNLLDIIAEILSSRSSAAAE